MGAGQTHHFALAVPDEETQLQWIADAVVAGGGSLPEAGPVPSVPEAEKGDRLMRAVVRDDAERHRSFVERWRTRVDALTHARHRRMLTLILGEMLEQVRCFEQALNGRTDILGRHQPGASERGTVLATRWIE